MKAPAIFFVRPHPAFLASPGCHARGSHNFLAGFRVQAQFSSFHCWASNDCRLLRRVLIGLLPPFLPCSTCETILNCSPMSPGLCPRSGLSSCAREPKPHVSLPSFFAQANSWPGVRRFRRPTARAAPAAGCGTISFKSGALFLPLSLSVLFFFPPFCGGGKTTWRRRHRASSVAEGKL